MEQAVTAGLISAGVEVNGAERPKERRCPPDSPGRREKCRLRCGEFISLATCTVIVLHYVSHLDSARRGHANEELKIGCLKVKSRKHQSLARHAAQSP